MKIFYGVQGTGNGHISRARAMNAHLRQTNAEVQFLFSGRERNDYFDMDEFGDWLCCSGLTFSTSHGKVRPIETLKQNHIRQLWQDIKSLDLSGFDLVIHDFEPVTAWAAKRQGIATISLGHQYAFGYPVPLAGDSVMSRALIRHFAPATTRLGLHWHHFDAPILPPIVHLDHTLENQYQDKILVYLGFESPEEVLALLHQSPDTEFVYYGKFSGPSRNKNVFLQPLSVDGFKRDLHSCKGVVCNAGFELASEALQLGKKLLVKPLHGQMEQLSNALALEQLDLGSSMNSLSVDALRQWLNDERYPQCHYPDVAKAITEWLLMGENRCSVEQLSSDLWRLSTLQKRSVNGSCDSSNSSGNSLEPKEATPA